MKMRTGHSDRARIGRGRCSAKGGFLRPRRYSLPILLLSWLITIGPTRAEPQASHGGPIRALAAQNGIIVSAGFDGTAIVWPEGRTLRGHNGPVAAAGILADGTIATGGADGKIILWRAPPITLQGHTAPIAAIATQGQRLATASWDGTARIWAEDGSFLTLSGHTGPVNAIAFAPAPDLAVSAGYDGTIRRWAPDGTQAAMFTPGLPQNAVAAAPDGEIAAGGADGTLRLYAPDGTTRSLVIDTTPITSLALSPDGAHLAATSLGGTALIVERASLRITTVFLTTEHPLWAIAWDRDTILTGGATAVIQRWDATTGRALESTGTALPTQTFSPTDRGAQVFRACSACHSLTADTINHAGPSLHAILGRHIASLPGYAYSPALRTMDLIWTPNTIARLF